MIYSDGFSNGLDQYRDGFVVSDINANTDTLSFTNGLQLTVGDATGDVTEAALRRIQIREAIKAHFDKERHMLSASFAKRAEFDKDHWQLSDVTTTVFHEKSTEVVTAPVERWDVALSPQLLSTVVMAPESLSISGLWGYIHYLADQGLNNGRYWLAFWVKVLQPLVTAALVLMAISFIFGPLRSVTLGQRVFTGVLVGFTFRIAQDLLGPSSLVFGFSPLFAVLVPAGVCALGGLWLLRRAG